MKKVNSHFSQKLTNSDSNGPINSFSKNIDQSGSSQGGQNAPGKSFKHRAGFGFLKHKFN
jgi:hypothetical protein